MNVARKRKSLCPSLFCKLMHHFFKKKGAQTTGFKWTLYANELSLISALFKRDKRSPFFRKKVFVVKAATRMSYLIFGRGDKFPFFLNFSIWRCHDFHINQSYRQEEASNNKLVFGQHSAAKICSLSLLNSSFELSWVIPSLVFRDVLIKQNFSAVLLSDLLDKAYQEEEAEQVVSQTSLRTWLYCWLISAFALRKRLVKSRILWYIQQQKNTS